VIIIPVYRRRSAVDFVGAADRGCLRRQSVDSHILRAEEGFNRKSVYRIAVDVRLGIIVGRGAHRQVAAASGVLQPRVNRLRVRPRVMMDPVTLLMGCRRPDRPAAALNVQLRVELRSVAARNDQLSMLLPLRLLLRAA